MMSVSIKECSFVRRKEKDDRGYIEGKRWYFMLKEGRNVKNEGY